MEKVGAELLSLSVIWLKIFFSELKLCSASQTWTMYMQVSFFFFLTWKGNHCVFGRLQVFPLLAEVT